MPVLAMPGKCEPWCLLIIAFAASSAAGLAVATFRSVLRAFCLFFLSFLCHASSFRNGVVSRLNSARVDLGIKDNANAANYCL